jgi:hypothetical protein
VRENVQNKRKIRRRKTGRYVEIEEETGRKSKEEKIKEEVGEKEITKTRKENRRIRRKQEGR